MVVRFSRRMRCSRKGFAGRRPPLRKGVSHAPLRYTGPCELPVLQDSVDGRRGVGGGRGRPVVLFPDHVSQFFTGKATLLQNREQCSFCEFVVEGDNRSIMALLETYYGELTHPRQPPADRKQPRRYFPADPPSRNSPDKVPRPLAGWLLLPRWSSPG